MTQLVYDNLLASLYLLTWVVTLIWYHWRYHSLDAGSAIIGTYILYATSSILTLNDPLFSVSYNPLKVFPYIYLYVMLMIALLPIIYTHRHPSDTISDPSTRVLKIIAIISILSAILLIPEIIANFSSGLVKLFTDIDAGSENYMEQSEESEEAGHQITNLPAVIYNSIAEITIFLFFYFMTLKNKPRLLIIGLLIATVIGLVIPIMHGSRGSVIMTTLTVIGAYMLFRRYLSSKINHAVQLLGVGALIAIALPIAAITVSRFGNMNGGIFGFLNWYVGQGNLYFNNYALDAGGIRHGDRTINMVKRLVDPSTPKNYNEQREKNHNMEINDDVFTTFVGDIALDFGPIATVIIFVVFFGWILTQIRPRDGTISLHQLLLVYLTMCICMQGGMALFSFSYTANLRLITMFMLYAYLRYHDALLKRFPLTTISSEVNEEDHQTAI